MEAHFIIVLLVSVLRVQGGKDCIRRDQCSCVFDDDKSIVDLTSLGNTDGTPRFKDVKVEDGSLLSYNPCNSFNDGQCTNAAVCLRARGKTVQAGDADDVDFEYNDDNGELFIEYSSSDSSEGVETKIKLVCDLTAVEPTLTGDGQTDSDEYSLVLTSVCACPNGCTSTGPTEKTPSPGGKKLPLSEEILFVVIGSVLFAWCVLGAVAFLVVVRRGTQNGYERI